MPDEIDQRLGEIETALAALDDRPVIYDPAEITRTGVFFSIDSEAKLKIEREFVRPEDEAPITAEPDGDGTDQPAVADPEGGVQRTTIIIGGNPPPEAETPDEDDLIRPRSDRLVTELTAHRTPALRVALANDPELAVVAVLHALCLGAFYAYASNTCLEIAAKSTGFHA